MPQALLARTIPSDVNGNSIVDIEDIYLASNAFGAKPEHPRWNPEADVNNDEIVGIKDMVLIAHHFGNTCEHWRPPNPDP